MKKTVIIVFVMIFFLCSPVFAQKIIKPGVYTNYYANDIFSLSAPEGFTKVQRKEQRVVFINEEDHMSISIQCTQRDTIDEKLFDKLKDDGVGYSDEYWENDTCAFYIGENFGCIHFEMET